jgi:DNA-binding MarR family transcriptional regulator
MSIDAGPPRRIAGLVRLVFEQASATMATELLRRHPELRTAHLQVFNFGSIEGRRVTELAARSAMTKQSMHELVVHLERAGYVRREPDPTDSRARLIRLTPRGLDLEDDLRAASARLHLDWRERLGPSRFDELWSALQEITGRTGDPPAAAALRRQASTLGRPTR